MATVTDLTDRTICHCLQIRECEIRTAVECGDVQSVRDVMNTTTAGTGCTACHCAIRQILEERSLAPQR
jgi:NifU-like protein